MTTRRSVSVERLPAGWEKSNYDLAIAAAGYEQRSRHILEVSGLQSELKVAAAFDENQIFEFETNLERFKARGFLVDVVSDEKYAEWCGNVLHGARRSSSPLKVIADISSLSRVRLAHLVSAIRECGTECDIIVDFIYSLASFTPPIQQENPNSHVGPVTKAYTGWWTEPDRELSAVVGLGYEPDKALGAVEYLQAQDVWLFMPESNVAEYTPCLQEANDSLVKITEPSHLFEYRVSDPLDCFSRLQSLTQGLQTSSNVVLLPFGPKLFVLCCLLVAASDQSIAVWRVSAQSGDKPVNRSANGDRYGLRVLFTVPSRTEAEPDE